MLAGPKEQTEAIVSSISKNIKTIFPIKIGNRELTVDNIDTHGLDQADPKNFTAIADAKARDKTYGINIMGDVTIKEGEI